MVEPAADRTGVVQPGNTTRLLADVTEAARVAGEMAMRHFGERLEVVAKPDGSPVTVADREAEQAARRWISARYPDDAIVGEELGEQDGTSPRRWFIDPVDGTRAFVLGVPLWGSMIGVSHEDRLVAGAVFCPAVDLLVAAADGLGCTCNGRPCSVSDVGEVSEAVILTTDSRFRSHPDRASRWAALGERVRMSRTWGDCFGYLLVATGRAELMVDDRLGPWDAAALVPIIREAGGVFSDWRGRETAFGGDAIASNRRLAAAFRHALGAGP